MTEHTDARGVSIKPGASVIYGFGVGRSVAMAEGVTEEKDGHLSLTPSGRVWVRIVRRSYSSGTEQRVHVAPDRLVIVDALPASPQATQTENNIARWEAQHDHYQGRLADLADGGPLTGWETRYPREEIIRDYSQWLTRTEKDLTDNTEGSTS